MVFAGTGVWKSKRGMSLFGRRCVFINDAQYSYNVRNELTSGQDQTYAYDDIGNRTTAEGKTYTANNLNQYTAIDDFTPQYDADGNQTLIKTPTGIWSVTYNAENRPIRWTRGDTIVTMTFDRLGRRVDYKETRAGQVATHFRFVYDNFLCVQRLNAANGNAVRTEFVWDPTEPIATRPLVMRAKNWGLNLLLHPRRQQERFRGLLPRPAERHCRPLRLRPLRPHRCPLSLRNSLWIFFGIL